MVYSAETVSPNKVKERWYPKSDLGASILHGAEHQPAPKSWKKGSKCFVDMTWGLVRMWIESTEVGKKGEYQPQKTISNEEVVE